MNAYTLPVLGLTVFLAIVNIMYVKRGINPGTKVVLSLLTSLAVSLLIITLFA